jgi:hypothetical protein
MTFESDEVRSIDRHAATDGRPMRESPAAERRQPVIGRSALLFTGLVAVAALAVVLSPADGQPFAARIAILMLGIVAAWKVLGRSAAVTASTPERFELELRQPPMPTTEIAGLRSVETDLRMSTASAFGLEFRLKPMLRDLAAWRLARNHGVDLATAPDAARQILGDPLWNLTRAAETFPEFRDPGPPIEDVDAGLDRLARI